MPESRSKALPETDPVRFERVMAAMTQGGTPEAPSSTPSIVSESSVASLRDWPEAERRAPPLSSPTYAVRGPLARWLEQEAARAGRDFPACRVLDVGCGRKPYYPFFAPFADAYVGVDVVDNPYADVTGTAEALPVADASFDVVLCTQALEHCPDPAGAVRELARVVAPGGRVLASTHGVQVYHPSPEDYWRFTHAGLERLFRENGAWGNVTVLPASGTAACLAMLVSIYVDLACRKARVAWLGRAFAWLANTGARALDRHVRVLREPVAGTLFANLHVVAEAPVE
jgi:SAM-dependent methyltransferase